MSFIDFSHKIEPLHWGQEIHTRDQMPPDASVVKPETCLPIIFSLECKFDIKEVHEEKNLRALQWRHNEHDGVSNHQPHDCLLNLHSGPNQRKHQSSASLAFVREIHRWPVNPHKRPVTRKMFSFDDVTMWMELSLVNNCTIKIPGISFT